MHTFYVDVPDNSTVTVSVMYLEQLDPILGLADELFRTEASCEVEPRASIGEVNCTTLTVPVTLENGSHLEMTFYVFVGPTRTRTGTGS